jgi:hypothetical protein
VDGLDAVDAGLHTRRIARNSRRLGEGNKRRGGKNGRGQGNRLKETMHFGPHADERIAARNGAATGMGEN